MSGRKGSRPGRRPPPVRAAGAAAPICTDRYSFSGKNRNRPDRLFVLADTIPASVVPRNPDFIAPDPSIRPGLEPGLLRVRGVINFSSSRVARSAYRGTPRTPIRGPEPRAYTFRAGSFDRLRAGPFDRLRAGSGRRIGVRGDTESWVSACHELSCSVMMLRAAALCRRHGRAGDAGRIGGEAGLVFHP